MQMELMKASDRKPIGKLRVVRNFRQIIESRDISLMNKEVYQFLNLYCGFIAHYNINGFKATYSRPESFAGVFIRHFDCEHRYFNGIYPCHEEPYRETGYIYLNLKKEFETQGFKLNCEACGNEYEVRVLKEGEDFNDFRVICCLFCGQQIKLY